MSAIDWIKLKTGTFHDEKIRLIESLPQGDSVLIIFFKLLCLAGTTNDGGYIYLNERVPYSAEMLSIIMNRQLTLINFALTTLSEFGLIEVESDGKIFISKWELHQNVEKMELIRAQTKKRVSKWREGKKSLLPEHTPECNVTVTLPVTQCNAVDTDTDTDTDTEKKYSEYSDEYSLASLLYELIKERNPKHKKPNLQKWAHYVHLLIERDGRTKEEIEAIIRFTQQDSFWMNNILSTEKLRQKFDQLYLVMNGRQIKQTPTIVELD